MLLDCGRRGMLEVEQIREQKDLRVGMNAPEDVFQRESYLCWGKAGCTLVRSIPPEDMSPEVRIAAKVRAGEAAGREWTGG